MNGRSLICKRKKRACKAGAGVEATLGKCDTPGFSLSADAEVKYDHKRTKKIFMPRNHRRVNQTSLALLQSWRGNCDFQLLIYDCDPLHPNISEIARVTDYVVSYACKGNTSVKEEREQNKHLILAADDNTGDKDDIKRIAKKIMNKAASKRIISKQEACCLLGDLDLFLCSETIENVSISNSKMLSVSDESRQSSATRTFIQQYKSRPREFETVNLIDYFHLVKNANRSAAAKMILPNFVGINGSPKFPVTDDYARHTIIVYKPWRIYPSNLNWKEMFESFINSPESPLSAKISYNRVMRRHYDKMTGYEVTASSCDHKLNHIDEDDRDLMDLVGLKANTDNVNEEEALLKLMKKGEEFDWGKPEQVSKQVQMLLIKSEVNVYFILHFLCALS